MTTVYVDADACPVKPEVMRVAARHGLEVVFVSNMWMRLPAEWEARQVVVENQLDAADDWIAGHVVRNDIVVTADVPLAERTIKGGARVIDPQGRVISEVNIAGIVATRDLMHDLRESGEVSGGPAPFRKEDRSRFLQELELVIQAVKRDGSTEH